jgi:hypothetical protein
MFTCECFEILQLFVRSLPEALGNLKEKKQEMMIRDLVVFCVSVPSHIVV